ncbi:MAG: HAD family hydrolase [Candidatus Dormibacteraeota bacterium]|nr:HAD family hydrolase [Candidatus Dormibacteraeota bacterium]
MPYRGVIFDLYGTLIDGWTSKEADLRARELGEALEAPLGPFLELMESTYTERATGRLGDVAPMLRALCLQVGHEPSDCALARAAELRIAQFREVLSRPRPEVPSLLATLRDRGVSVGLITDCSAETPRLWPELGWSRPVQSPLFSWVEGRRKPDPELYRKALALLGLDAEECLYVGDGGSQELTGAEAVGLAARRILYGNHLALEHMRYDPDQLWEGESITSFTEILPLVCG